MLDLLLWLLLVLLLLLLLLLPVCRSSVAFWLGLDASYITLSVFRVSSQPAAAHHNRLPIPPQKTTPTQPLQCIYRTYPNSHSNLQTTPTLSPPKLTTNTTIIIIITSPAAPSWPSPPQPPHSLLSPLPHRHPQSTHLIPLPRRSPRLLR
jgi:hypothetical protein